jgi:hypothetical protein
LDDVPKLRASYAMTKLDPCVIVSVDSKNPIEAAAKRRSEMCKTFQMSILLAKKLLNEYKIK